MAENILQQIYEQHKHDVYTYLLGLTRDKSLSEDLTSEVFLGAMQSLSSFKGDSGIKTWLFSIARYRWYAHLRKSKKELSHEDFLTFYWSDEQSLESGVITKELVEKIYSLLEQEPPRNRAIVLMRIEGYSYFEIAKKHSISENSARVLDFRTKKKIRAAMQKEGFVDE